MPQLRISIALATFQGERFLAQQLASFVAQTRLPHELCISDDGSTDGTMGVIRAFASSAPFPVQCTSNPVKGGVNKNFEHALRQCTGDVVLFSDQDDVWLPSHVASLVTPMEDNAEIVAVVSDSSYVDEDLKLTGSTDAQANRFPAALRDATMRLPGDQFQLVLRHNMHNGHGMGFRRRLLPLLLPITDTFVYDEWVLLLCAAAGYITYETTPQTLHRQHQQQTVKSRNKDLQLWAKHSKNVSADQERVQEEKWSELLERVREHRDMVPKFEFVERALRQKYEFVVRRRLNRRLPLPSRLLVTSQELLLGRYHRLGRGFLTFARDLYGVRQS
jgi:hypothetical protein